MKPHCKELAPEPFCNCEGFCHQESHQQENTLSCVLNLSAAFLLQLVLVVPPSLFLLVVQNWVLGSAVCYLLPMLQVSALIRVYILVPVLFVFHQTAPNIEARFVNS